LHLSVDQAWELADAALAQLQISHLAERPVAMSSGGRGACHRPCPGSAPRSVFDERATRSTCSPSELATDDGSLAKAGIRIFWLHDLSDVIPGDRARLTDVEWTDYCRRAKDQM
jgi:hypothetical protein